MTEQKDARLKAQARRLADQGYQTMFIDPNEILQLFSQLEKAASVLDKAIEWHCSGDEPWFDEACIVLAEVKGEPE